MAGDPKLGREYELALRDYSVQILTLADRVTDPNHAAYVAQGLAVGQSAVALDKARRAWNATVPDDYEREDTGR